MPRPTNKQELLSSAQGQFDKLWSLIDALSEEERSAGFCFGEELIKKEAHWARDKNIRDVLVHLYEWHQLLLGWVEANLNGEAKPFLPAPYNWKTYGEMNLGFWQKHQGTAYVDAVAMLRGSHQEVLALIGRFSDDELFRSKYYQWTGTTSLGSYCVSATSSHYDWAIKKLKQHKKTYRATL